MADKSAKDPRVRVGKPKKSAGGVPGIAASMQYALAPLDATAEVSNTPVSKSTVIRLDPAGGASAVRNPTVTSR